MTSPSTPLTIAASTSAVCFGVWFCAVVVDRPRCRPSVSASALSWFCMCTKNGKPRHGSDVAIFRSCACPGRGRAPPPVPAARERQHVLQSSWCSLPGNRLLSGGIAATASLYANVAGTIRSPPIPVNPLSAIGKPIPATSTAFQIAFPSLFSRMRPMTPALIFDIGNVLIRWDARLLYRRLLPDEAAIDAFFAEVDFHAWNLEFDRGVPWDGASRRSSARHPHRAALIAAFHHRWHETVPGPVEGAPELLAELAAAGVPLYAITNFSGAKFAETRDAGTVADDIRRDNRIRAVLEDALQPALRRTSRRRSRGRSPRASARGRPGPRAIRPSRGHGRRSRPASPGARAARARVALAAPVGVGIEADRRRPRAAQVLVREVQDALVRSCRRGSWVMRPCSMPKVWCGITCATGARQFIVQEPIETIVCFGAVVVIVVHADHEREVHVLRRRRRPGRRPRSSGGVPRPFRGR